MTAPTTTAAAMNPANANPICSSVSLFTDSAGFVLKRVLASRVMLVHTAASEEEEFVVTSATQEHTGWYISKLLIESSRQVHGSGDSQNTAVGMRENVHSTTPVAHVKPLNWDNILPP